MTAPPVSWKLIAGGSRRNPKWYDTRGSRRPMQFVNTTTRGQFHVRRTEFADPSRPTLARAAEYDALFRRTQSRSARPRHRRTGEAQGAQEPGVPVTRPGEGAEGAGIQRWRDHSRERIS